MGTLITVRGLPQAGAPPKNGLARFLYATCVPPPIRRKRNLPPDTLFSWEKQLDLGLFVIYSCTSLAQTQPVSPQDVALFSVFCMQYSPQWGPKSHTT
ncbi:hypothetical protein [Hydrogenophaga sp.]|uniref:hypothetical protein n=1 Tax=Hydrogenophaga sp. TaxID=1904254 RepID=UPI002628D7CD|nr:hypothetical protein [Hydrogenophaga sp.]